MSTKCTISHDKDGKLKYHLYQECYENDNIWLQLDDAQEFEVFRDGSKTRVRLAIPISVFRHMVEGWLDSEWGKNPSLDGYKPSTAEFEQGIKMLETIVALRKERKISSDR